MRLLLLFLLAIPAYGAADKPTPVEILVKMVETQQKTIDSLVETVQAQDKRIAELERKLGPGQEPKVKPMSAPQTHGCYAWLSDGGREVIPCPKGKQ